MNRAGLSLPSSLMTGFSDLDEQHSAFFDLGNRILALLPQRDATTLIQAVTELERHAGEHFDTEERVMFRSRYPHLEEHRDAHDRLRRAIAALRTRVEAGAHEVELATGLHTVLGTWLTEHIGTEDQRFAEFAWRTGDGRSPTDA